MSNQVKNRTHRSIPKKPLVLNVPGVTATRTTRGDLWVCIKLVGPQQLFSEYIDGCFYAKGCCIRYHHDKPGDYCTHHLGNFYSSHTLVKELRFDKNNGIRVRLRVKRDDPRFQATIEQLARCLVRRAAVYDRLHNISP